MFDTEHHVSLIIQGTQWLQEWGIDLPMMKPVALQKFIMRDWETGRVLKQYDLDDHQAPSIYHRKDMHRGLLRAVISEEGKGIPCKLVIDHT